MSIDLSEADLEWDDIEEASLQTSPCISQMAWWHSKRYWRNPPDDGSVVQTDEKGRCEIPYWRKLFWPSGTRFGLGSECPVAYFSNDQTVNCCETIEQYRDRRVSWEELKVYFHGGANPTPSFYYYPLRRSIAPTARILDLTVESPVFFDSVAQAGCFSTKERVRSALSSRHRSVYPFTQELARLARRRGFDGLTYKSARVPSGIVLPDQNLVVFNEAVVLKDGGLA